MWLFCEVFGKPARETETPTKVIDDVRKLQRNIVQCCGCSNVVNPVTCFDALTGERKTHS